MFDDVSTELAALLLALLASGLATMVWLWTRRRKHLEFVAFEARRPVPWRGIHVLLGFVLFIVLRGAAAVAALSQMQAPQAAELPPRGMLLLFLADAAGSLAALALVAALLVVRCGAKPRDLGLTLRAAGRDLRLGVLGFFAVLVPIYGLQVLATALFQPSSEHPLIKLLKESPEPLLMLGAAVAAVLVAPVVEEFFFRVMLQGWLEGIAMRSEPPQDASPAADDAAPPSDQANAPPAPETAEQQNPYASPAAENERQAAISTPEAKRLMVWPIVGSSALFASVHIGHGVDFIPLFFLSLALGYLYQRTHRLWPSMILHTCLNATSLVMLWLSLKG